LQKKLQNQAKPYVKKNNKRKVWKKVVQAMGCVVVFCTTYALILPAITMEKPTVCQMEAHTHTEQCYTQVQTLETRTLSCTAESLNVHVHSEECKDSQGNLICGQADFVLHTHGPECQDENAILLCHLPAVLAHEHDSSCYQEVETGHKHTDACYTLERGELTCTTPESEGHAHSKEAGCYGPEIQICLIPESEEHTHGEGCFASACICLKQEVEGHSHSDACYAQQQTLICPLAEESIIEQKLICQKQEIKAHTHGENCYETVTDEAGNEQQKLICTETVVLEHVHSDSCYTVTETPVDTETLTCTQPEGHVHETGCYDEQENLICEIPENHTHGKLCYGQWELTCQLEEHVHEDACYSQEEDTQPEYICGLEEHVHAESCYDEAGALICQLEEHTHSEACIAEAEEEIPLVLPLNCKVEEHTHDGACVDENAVTICEKLEHVHTAECYGVAVAEFPYEDNQISMTVTVTSRKGLPEGLRMEVALLDTEDQDYTAYEGYAQENSDGELLALTGYQVQFFYKDREIQLPDAEIVADLTVKPVAEQETEEPQEPEAAEETEPLETLSESMATVFAMMKNVQAPALMSLLSDEPASDAAAEETPDTVVVTVLQQNEEQVISRGTATFPDEQTQNSKITLALTGNTTFAVAREGVANPNFTVQFYANFPRMQRYTETEKANLPADQLPYLLDVIDTSDDGDGDGGSLPRNGAGTNHPGTTKGVTYLHLRQVPGAVAGQDKLHVSDTSTNRNVYEVMAELEQTQVYTDNSFTYYTGLDIHTIDKLHVNTHYELVDLWIGKPDADGNVAEWTVYTTVAVNAASYKEDGSDPMLAVDASVSNPTSSSNPDTVGQWMHGYGADGNIDFSKPWYRKFRQTADESDTTWINIPHGGNGNVTKIVRVADIHNLTFTNDEANATTNKICISSNDVIRLVYDLPRTDQSMAANLFDYDITDTSVYVSDTTSGTPVLQGSPYIYSNANDAMYDLTLTWGVYDTFNDRLYTKTSSGTSSTGYTAYGINSQAAYNNTTGATAYLAFGNDNTGVFRGDDTLNGYYINSYNDSNTFKGCHFGLVQNSLPNGQPFLKYANNLAAPSLFNEEALGYVASPGKTPYPRQQLVFRRMGDTYVLTDVNRDVQSAKVKEDKLNQFTVSHVYSDNSYLFTNNFWPMDGTVENSTTERDMKFGSIDAGTGGKERYYVGADGSYGYFPVSDDSLNHNSYFGMTYSVEFTMDGQYCGPLEYLFYGDDDMWVYLTDVNNPSNSRLICDIGGVHSSVGSFTDLWDYIPKNTPGTYRLDFFYTERGASGSSCYMEFTLPNMASIPQVVPNYGSVRVKKEVPNADTNEEFLFQFDLDGNFTDNFGYSHTDSTGKMSSGTIKDGNTFTLKKDEIISITGIPKGTIYTITELLTENQNYNVTWTRQGTTTLDNPNAITGTIENGITHTYTCTNVALGSLEVKKTIQNTGDKPTDENAAFPIEVTLTDAEGNPLSGTFGGNEFVSGKCTVNLKHNGTVVFTGIPVGTNFTVRETAHDGYHVSYQLGEQVATGEDGISGTIDNGNEVCIQVVNTTGYELPETGGRGTATYALAGVMLMMISTVYLMYTVKRRGREGR